MPRISKLEASNSKSRAFAEARLYEQLQHLSSIKTSHYDLHSASQWRPRSTCSHQLQVPNESPCSVQNVSRDISDHCSLTCRRPGPYREKHSTTCRVSCGADVGRYWRFVPAATSCLQKCCVVSGWPYWLAVVSTTFLDFTRRKDRRDPAGWESLLSWLLVHIVELLRCFFDFVSSLLVICVS